MQDTQTFICPKCFKRTTIFNTIPETVAPISGVPLSKQANFSFKPMNILYSVMCEDCKELMFDCDQTMIEPITTLLENGYETLYCCEGHHHKIEPDHCCIGDICCIPYICFVPDNVYNRNIAIFANTYSICENLAKKYKYINVEIEDNGDVQQQDEETLKISNCDRIRISANYPTPDRVEVDEDISPCGWDIPAELFEETKKEFAEYLHELIAILPDISYIRRNNNGQGNS